MAVAELGSLGGFHTTLIMSDEESTNGISAAMTMLIAEGMGARQGAWFPGWFGQIIPVITLIIGIVLIIASRNITEFLFKAEDE